MTAPTLTRPSSNGSVTRTGQRSETQRQTARNHARVVLGALLLVASALAGAVLYADIGHRHDVVVVTRAVSAGEVLEARDLGSARVAVSPGVVTVPASQESAFVGRLAAVALVPGSLLLPADLASGPGLAAGETVIGATLKPGQAPLGLRPGDSVLLVVMPSQLSTGSGKIGGPGTPTLGTVVSLNPVPDSSGSLAVSLAVAPDAAPSLAVAGAQGQLALILEPR